MTPFVGITHHREKLYSGGFGVVTVESVPCGGGVGGNKKQPCKEK